MEVFPDRASVPRELWLRLLSDPQDNLDVLVFSDTFFARMQYKIVRLPMETRNAVGRSGCVR
ncbi:hypothetical protein [Nonomuraea indica]|uniref:hypothetical protein n=1 Tax=Nonomuraea indica TaxID=1581193 RepID=UPI000C7C5898|nr:hypothetical protein [Nonomuraea indica]